MTPARPSQGRLKATRPRDARARSPPEGSEAWACLDGPCLQPACVGVRARLYERGAVKAGAGASQFQAVFGLEREGQNALGSRLGPCKCSNPPHLTQEYDFVQLGFTGIARAEQELRCNRVQCMIRSREPWRSGSY